MSFDILPQDIVRLSSKAQSPRNVQVMNGTGLPTRASLNTERCTVATAPPSPPPPASTGSAEEGGQLTTSNGQIIGLNGQPLQMNGLNYFGFDDGNTMVDGLWVGEQSQSLLSEFWP